MAVSQTLTITEVEDSISIANNTNKVKIEWKSTQTGESHNLISRTAYYWVSINGGEEVKYSVSYTLPKASTKTIVSTTITVPHKDDGTGTITVRTWMDTRISAGEVALTKTLNLTTIPRATSLDSLSCATDYFTGKLTYKYTPKGNAFYNRCNISLNLNGEYIRVKSVDFGKKAASQQTATVTLSGDELEIIYKELPNDPKGVLRFTFRTYSDSEYSDQIGDAVYREVELRIPDDSTTKPAVTLTLTPVGELPDAFDGLYIQGKTMVKATVSAKGKYDADIKSYSIKLDGVTHNSVSSYTSDYLTNGSIKVSGYAKDTRGYTGSADKTITVLGYAKPKILNAEAVRCDEDGNLADNGTYLKIKAERSYTPVKADGEQKNFCQIRFRYKLSSATSYSGWTTILAKSSLTSDKVETDALLGGVLSAASSYHVQVQAIDDIGESASTTITVPTDKVYWHRDGARNSFTFGGYVEEDNTFAIAGGVNFTVKSLSGEDVTLSDTGWIDLGLSSIASEPDSEYDFGRNGFGCYYRVINGNHVYVAFNCACEYAAGENNQLNATAIPSQYRPDRYCYAILPTGGKSVVRAFVSPSGQIKIGWIQSLISGEETTAANITWVDGYIDYWV